MGFDTDIFDVLDWYILDYLVCSKVKHKSTGYIFGCATVYGTASDEFKQQFINELHSFMSSSRDPIMIGGDFNLVRCQEDKNNGNIDFHWCDRFNEWIDGNGLLEIKSIGWRFTWSNNQESPVMSLIDRIFCSIELDQMFPLASAKTLPRRPSDHVPILGI
ncbi:hypothetical protein PR202_gb07636 [Eleusine coracana subsp. coracana]|uniref:Endonuclease/exonuclease/phosphatase domain-containing protein n=1 Tax=Eleusine coracana subsp. coracana TaxID=191504 RepID=A0AAV5EA71_ELECO|nr:hypothetical protein PR202_gb07636 [Eleusine coracana subsp. coracana]